VVPLQLPQEFFFYSASSETQATIQYLSTSADPLYLACRFGISPLDDWTLLPPIVTKS
jgi:hypothetical protein